ncbi:MAG: molybdopterin biosynthesis protein, partial [Chloroflexi bacterium]|nr:molybdopterin biosynthesis protein [Chloroflexota bacterium]
MARNIYLEDLPLTDAWDRITGALDKAGLWQPLAAETIPLADALGRVTAAPIWAVVSAPHYHASAMDGYAVRARDTREATETNPVTFTLIAGEAEIERVERPMFALNTGQPLPLWADAVVMIEHVQPGEIDDTLIIRSSVAPWQHVRPMGEDMVATELVLPANHTLRPVDLGAVAGSGHAQVTVWRKPRVAIIPTGSELVSAEEAAGQRIEAGRIIEYNSLVLGAQIEAWGGEPVRWDIVPDDYDAIREAVFGAAEVNDLVLVNAGSSAGTEDYTVHVIRELGEVLVHGIAVRPGHPVIFGLLNVDTRRVPVIGVPGYPVSAALTGEILVEPLLARWLGRPPHEPALIEAELSRKVTSPPGDDDYVRVTVGRVGERTIATPLARGAGVITSLVRADGIVRIPRFSEGREAGQSVRVHLYRTPHAIDRTIVAIGSHDLTLDLLAQFVA